MPSLRKAGFQIMSLLRVFSRFDDAGRFAREIRRLIDINDVNIDDAISIPIPKAMNQ